MARVTARAYLAPSVICRSLGHQPATPFENLYCISLGGEENRRVRK